MSRFKYHDWVWLFANKRPVVDKVIEVVTDDADPSIVLYKTARTELEGGYYVWEWQVAATEEELLEKAKIDPRFK